MSDMKASVDETSNGFHVQGYEEITYDYTFLDNVFSVDNPQLAEHYKRWGRVLAVTDVNVNALYNDKIEQYFKHYNLTLKIFQTKIGEKAKSIPTLLSMIQAFNDFGIYRKEPVLCIGGGLVNDVAGFACAVYRRNTNWIRIPTTVIGLIDASIGIKVAVNFGNYKNRLGAYHAPQHTYLDFTFLKTLPKAQIRNGFAELIKISSCADLTTFDLLDKYCEQLIDTAFGRADGTPAEVRDAADIICKRGIHRMLQLESPNLHEIMLDRVIAYGHTWSPLHELVPETPLRHGHAISIDMAFSATLANSRGLLSKEEHQRLLQLFSRAGLSMDHHQFDEETLLKGTAAIMKTRDGLLRAAVPHPLGECVFLNDVDAEEMNEALRRHKEIMRSFPREGEGIEAYVDASDTGEDVNGGQEKEMAALDTAVKEAGSLNHLNGHKDDLKPVTNGVSTPIESKKKIVGVNGVNGADEGVTNGVNGFTNGARA